MDARTPESTGAPQDHPLELCGCPHCGLPAEVVTAWDVAGRPRGSGSDLVGVRCVGRHWFFGLRDRLVA